MELVQTLYTELTNAISARSVFATAVLPGAAHLARLKCSWTFRSPSFVHCVRQNSMEGVCGSQEGKLEG